MNTLRIYQAPSGQWSGQLLAEDGVELAGVAGCATAEDVECEAQDAGMVYDTAIYDNTAATKAMMALCKSKGWDDCVRLLDQSEVMGKAWGECCTMQAMDYLTGEWMQCTPGGNVFYSLSDWYALIRTVFEWDGPVRLAVAAE